MPLKSVDVFPHLSPPDAAPEVLRESLAQEVDRILAGHWHAFGHLELKVDDPPKWHCDYLAGQELATDAPGFRLNHRALPAGADIKLVWELSRWHQLLRLAQAAYVLDDQRAGEKCVLWLEDWVKHNPPYRGWNWTSALEAGMRLIQFTWIDALLAGRAEQWGFEAELDTLRYELLPTHVWYVWRHKSFGSSANNHLLGELAGLILAVVRWPALVQWGTTIEELQRRWETEVLAQFAPDGGNREQALNYQLFSFEFCWQVRMALIAGGRKVASPIEDRLVKAARFYWATQANCEPWDYGDSDNAFVTPVYASDHTAIQEWQAWMHGERAGQPIAYWLGDPPSIEPPLARGKPLNTMTAGDWLVYPDTGIAVCESGDWWLRWDLSPLGYLKTAAHGHLDALHLSLWQKRVALVIDPGTGAYYGDLPLRHWLASRAAHNAPSPVGDEYPRRLGPFLWAVHHQRPTWKMIQASQDRPAGLRAELALPDGLIRRTIYPSRVGRRLAGGGRILTGAWTPPGFQRALAVCAGNPGEKTGRADNYHPSRRGCAADRSRRTME